MVAGETGWTLIIPCVNITLTNVNTATLVGQDPNGNPVKYTVLVGQAPVTVGNKTYQSGTYCQMTVATGQFAIAGKYIVQLWLTMQGGSLRKCKEMAIALDPTLPAPS